MKYYKTIHEANNNDQTHHNNHRRRPIHYPTKPKRPRQQRRRKNQKHTNRIPKRKILHQKIQRNTINKHPSHDRGE